MQSKNVLAYFIWSTPSLWHGVRAYARDAGWMLIFPNHVHGAPQLKNQNFDGVLTLVGSHEVFNARTVFPNAKIVDLQATEGLHADATVGVDARLVGRIAADYLHEMGYRRFIGLALDVKIHTLENRLAGFSERIQELGETAHRFDYDFYMPRPDMLLQEVKHTVERVGFPLAVFSPDDNMADLFIQAVVKLGYRVPEDIAVLGSNNDRGFCEMCRVPLSSVDVNFSRLGYESSRLLDRFMQGDPDAPRHISIPPLMVQKRKSTEKVYCTDPMVRSILEYIGEHFAEKITAEHIIQDIHASRSVAYSRFRSLMGCSIGKQIERVRLEHAQTMLLNTDYKIDVVARLSGYQNTSAFCRTFKHAIGKTPSDFRSR